LDEKSSPDESRKNNKPANGMKIFRGFSIKTTMRIDIIDHTIP
jgi:hypothetical protein